MPAVDNIGYTGPSKLMDNYGWVQNTSNLSTVRETVDLVPEEGIDHNTLMRSIYFARQEKGEDLQERPHHVHGRTGEGGSVPLPWLRRDDRRSEQVHRLRPVHHPLRV